jgi:hypothetical protein
MFDESRFVEEGYDLALEYSKVGVFHPVTEALNLSTMEKMRFG